MVYLFLGERMTYLFWNSYGMICWNHSTVSTTTMMRAQLKIETSAESLRLINQ